jgi:membrane protein DedA with SNARE-associated domain
MLESFIQLILSFSEGMGYWGIIFLMTVESSFIPFPSEVVIPPAAYLAQTGVMNIYLVVLFGILGSLIGASINYFLARTLGRTIIYKIVAHKFTKFLLIDEIKIKKSEDFFLKYGKISTFTGRLIPVIRQLISIPAGFSRMNFSSFLFFTFIGSSIWIIILAILGYTLGSNVDLLKEYYHIIKNIIWVTLTVLIIYFSVKLLRKKQAKKDIETISHT